MPIISGGSGGTALGNVTVVTGTPAVGEVIAATSGTAAAWAVPLVNAVAVGDNSSNFTTTSATFVDLTGASVTVAAAAGDKLAVQFKGIWTGSLATAIMQFRAITTTGSNVVDDSVLDTPVATTRTMVGLASFYTVVSGDISAGNVAIKVQVASDGTHTLTIDNASINVWRLSVINLRQ